MGKSKTYKSYFAMDDLQYSINPDQTSVTVTFHTVPIAGAIEIPATVTYDKTTYEVTSIGSFAFRNCHELTSVKFPSSITSIGDFAFLWCNALTEVTIPLAVSSFGTGVFASCNELTHFVIDDNHPVFSQIDGVLFSKDYETIIAFPKSKVTDYTIPSCVKTIGNGAFAGLKELTSVTIPEGVTSIGEWAFAGCKALSAIIIPEGVTSIGNNAFYYCSSLTSVTIPSTVLSIGAYAFSYCRLLAMIRIMNAIPPSVSYNGFSFVNKDCCKLFVPGGSKLSYSGAVEWMEFANIVEDYLVTVSETATSPLTFLCDNGSFIEVKGSLTGDCLFVYDTQGTLLLSISLPVGATYYVNVGDKSVELSL